jgi:hypothetical protein
MLIVAIFQLFCEQSNFEALFIECSAEGYVEGHSLFCFTGRLGFHRTVRPLFMFDVTYEWIKVQ